MILERGQPGPAAAAHARRIHGAGRQPQSKLERVAAHNVAERKCVMDEQRGDSDRRRAGGAAKHACLVLWPFGMLHYFGAMQMRVSGDGTMRLHGTLFMTLWCYPVVLRIGVSSTLQSEVCLGVLA